MSGIKEINQFVTANQVRKIVLQSLSPIINKLQLEFQKISQQSDQMRKYNQRSLKIEKNQNGIEATLKELSINISEIKSEIIELNNQDKKTFINCNVQLEKMRQQISQLKRQFEKNDEKFVQNNVKLEKLMKQMNLQKLSVDQSVQKIRQQLQHMYADTLELTKNNTLQFKRNSEKMEKMFFEIHRQRQKYKETTNIISIYQNEREEMHAKIQRSLSKLHNTVTQEQFSTLSYQLENYNQKSNQILAGMPNKHQVLQLKELVLHIEEKVKDFAKVLQLEVQVQSIKRNLDEDKTNKKGNHVAIEQILEKIQERLQQVKNKRIQQVQQAKKTTQQQIRDTKQQLKKLKQFCEQNFSVTLQKNSLLENFCEEFLENIPVRQQELKKKIVGEIKQVSDKINKRCDSIQSIGANLQESLSNFGNKIVKMKSDNQILEDTLRKQFKEFIKTQTSFQKNFKNVGKVISQIVETLLITQSLNLFNNVQDLKEKIVYTTYNDGIICEIEKLQNGEDVLFYRKRHLNFQAINKAIMKGLVDMVDNVICNIPFLCWNKERPSNFFVEKIYQNYLIVDQKSQNIDRKRNILPENHSSKTLELIPQANKIIIGEYQGFKRQKSNNSTRIESAGIYRTISTTKNNRQTKKNSKQKSTISTINYQKNDKYYYTKSRKQQQQVCNFEKKIFAPRSGRYSRLSNLI